jgi:hypothetical protein
VDISWTITAITIPELCSLKGRTKQLLFSGYAEKKYF